MRCRGVEQEVLEQWKGTRGGGAGERGGRSERLVVTVYMKSSSAFEAEAASSALETMFSALNSES